MRYLLSLFLFFSFKLFAECLNLGSVYSNGVIDLNGYSSATSVSQFTRTYNSSELANCQNLYEGKLADLVSTPTSKVYSHTVSVTANGTKYYCSGKLSYATVKTCPSGQSLDANCQCVSSTCSWATTPPYYYVPLSQSSCSNVHKIGSLGDTIYKWNFSWCPIDNYCYGRKYSCPSGQIFDPLVETCRYPTPDVKKCPSGYYKSCGSVTLDGVTSCFCDYICKENSSIRTRYNVSCSQGPIDDEPPFNPDAPTQPLPDDTKPTTTATTGNCFAAESLARLSCQAPKILSFSCDPKSGIVTKQECKDPIIPEKTPVNTGDDVKAATTQDIKDLGNKLPGDIRDSLKDYFTDGSMPHLEAIRGSLQASTILQADTNDKLDSISASSDASLVLQSDANDKLDGIKTSSDGIKTSVDALKGSVDSQKSVLDQIAAFFNDDSEYLGEEMPTSSDMSPDSNTTSGLDTVMNSVTQIQNQFDQAHNVFSSGVPNIVFQSGTCPTYHFMGHSVSLSSIGQSIAPYSSILSILIYISLMINAFRMIFGFFSKGV